MHRHGNAPWRAAVVVVCSRGCEHVGGARAARRCASWHFFCKCHRCNLADAAAAGLMAVTFREQRDVRILHFDTNSPYLWVSPAMGQVKCACVVQSKTSTHPASCPFSSPEPVLLTSNTTGVKHRFQEHRDSILSSPFSGEELFPLPFNFSHCSCSLACQCWLSNKLMVCLITSWDIRRCADGPSSGAAWEHSGKCIMLTDTVLHREPCRAD